MTTDQNTPLRILHVLYFATPYTSGLTLYVERLAREVSNLNDRLARLVQRGKAEANGIEDA